MDGAYLAMIGSKYLFFRFTLGSSGYTELHYKLFSTVSWEPEGAGIRVYFSLVVPPFEPFYFACRIVQMPIKWHSGS